MTIIGAVWRFSIAGRICSGEGLQIGEFVSEQVNYTIAGGLVVKTIVILNFVIMALIPVCCCCMVCFGTLMLQHLGAR